MTDNNNEDKPLKKKQDFGITEQNWLMLKEIEKGKTIKDAYYAVGYKGKDPNQPYILYHRLKKKLELVYDADNVDSLRLKIEAKKILDMEVDKRPIRAEVKLKAIETLSRLSGTEKKEAKTISPFIVFKHEDGKISASQGQVVEVSEVSSEGDDEAA